jgi:hypothetical protein
MNAGLEEEVIVEWQRDNVFADVSDIRVFIALSVEIRQVTKIGGRVDHEFIVVQDESVQVDRHQQDIAHRRRNRAQQSVSGKLY